MIGFLLPPLSPNPKAAILDATSSSADVRWVAASALGRVGGEFKEAAREALKKLLCDETEEVRAQAVEGLAEQCKRDSLLCVEWVSSALSDESPAVRCAAVDAALLLYTSPKEALLALVQDPDPSVRMAVASALGEIGDSSACGALRPMLKDGDAAVRTRAAAALAFLGDPFGEEVLLHSLSSPSGDVDDVIRGLGALRSREAVPLLRRMVGRWFAAPNVKAQAAVSLFACSDGRDGQTEIERFLFAKKTDLKISQLTALYRLPVKGFASRIASLMKDRDEMVASAAIQTLVALSSVDKDALNELITHRGLLAETLADELEDAILECKGAGREVL